MQNSQSPKIERKGREIHITPPNFTRTIVWLHGLGDSAEGFFPVFADQNISLVPEDFKVRLLTAPNVPVTINGGMACNSWYDIISLDRSKNSYSFEDVKKNSEYVSKCLDEELEILKGDSSKLYIGGFSQGCAMALHNGLSYKEKLGGIIGLSGYLFEQTKIPEEQPPLILCHGEDDMVINIEHALKSYERNDFYKRQGIELHRCKGLGHSLDQNVISLTKKFMKKILKR